MQRLINAIDKATRAGVYTLEETAQILQAIDQVGAVVKDHNERQQAAKNAVVPTTVGDDNAPEGPSKEEVKDKPKA
tara:strand:- start:19880 stop:20107 length:228 start_codon:yes stop_codon:yes gene_type:complete